MAQVFHFDTLDSTMSMAAELAAEGAESGSVVVAGTQTAGHGRLGRTWASEPGTGLYATFIFRPHLSPAAVPVVNLALGLATADAIVRVAGVPSDLRWPNDVLIGGRKCAGILAQLQTGALLAGIGINVNQASFPPELSSIATSLRLETGREHSVTELLDSLMETTAEQMNILVQQGKDAILRTFAQSSSYAAGRRVVVDQGPNQLRGTTDGLDANGFLMVRQDNGVRIQIIAGGVRPECS